MTDSVTSPRSPWGWGLAPLTQGLILIWKLQSQTRTTANQLDQQGKSQRERERERERERVCVCLCTQPAELAVCRTFCVYVYLVSAQISIICSAVFFFKVHFQWKPRDFNIYSAFESDLHFLIRLSCFYYCFSWRTPLFLV